MKKFFNSVDTMLAESLGGFARAHADIVRFHPDPACFCRAAAPVGGKVALVSGGGSGHEPLHAGFVGRGMLDAACPGQVFTSPTPDQVAAAARMVSGGAGVLFVVKNYAGDVMNFEMAAELLDLPQATVLIDDDVAVEASTWTAGRRGVAGTLVVALRERGRRVWVLTSCTVPAAGCPTFELGPDEIEMGVGIHGEPGRHRVTHATADDIAAELVGAIAQALAPPAGVPVLLLVNGFGGTPTMELYLMYHAAARLAAGRGMTIARSLVGNYVTSLDMAGCSITLALLDDELIRLWDAPVHTAALRWGC